MMQHQTMFVTSPLAQQRQRQQHSHPFAPDSLTGEGDIESIIAQKASWKERVLDYMGHDIAIKTAAGAASPFDDIGFLSNDPTGFAADGGNSSNNNNNNNRNKEKNVNKIRAPQDSSSSPQSTSHKHADQICGADNNNNNNINININNNDNNQSRLLGKQFSIRKGEKNHQPTRLDEHFSNNNNNTTTIGATQLPKITIKPQIASLIEQFQGVLAQQTSNTKSKGHKMFRKKSMKNGAPAAPETAPPAAIIGTLEPVGSSSSSKSGLKPARFMRKLHQKVVQRRGSMGSKSVGNNSVGGASAVSQITTATTIAATTTTATTTTPLHTTSEYPSAAVAQKYQYNTTDDMSVGASISSKKPYGRRRSGKFSKSEMALAQQIKQQQQLEALHQQAKQREEEYLQTIKDLQGQTNMQQHRLETQDKELEQLRNMVKWLNLNELATATTEMTYFRQRFFQADHARRKAQNGLAICQASVGRKETHISQLEEEVCKQEQKIIQLQSQLIPFCIGQEDDRSFNFGNTSCCSRGSGDDDITIGDKSFAEELSGHSRSPFSSNSRAERSEGSATVVSGNSDPPSITRTRTAVEQSITDGNAVNSNNDNMRAIERVNGASQRRTRTVAALVIEQGIEASQRRCRTAIGVLTPGEPRAGLGKGIPPPPAMESSTPSRRGRRTPLGVSRKTPRGLAEADMDSEKMQPVEHVPAQLVVPGPKSTSSLHSSRHTARKSSNSRHKRSTHISGTSRTPDKASRKKKDDTMATDILEGVAPPSSLIRSVSIGGSLHRRGGNKTQNNLSTTSSKNAGPISNESFGGNRSGHRRRPPSGSSSFHRAAPRRAVSMTVQKDKSRLETGSEHSRRDAQRKALIFSKLDEFLDVEKETAIPVVPMQTKVITKERMEPSPEEDDKMVENEQQQQRQTFETQKQESSTVQFEEPLKKVEKKHRFIPTVPPSA